MTSDTQADGNTLNSQVISLVMKHPSGTGGRRAIRGHIPRNTIPHTCMVQRLCPVLVQKKKIELFTPRMREEGVLGSIIPEDGSKQRCAHTCCGCATKGTAATHRDPGARPSLNTSGAAQSACESGASALSRSGAGHDLLDQSMTHDSPRTCHMSIRAGVRTVKHCSTVPQTRNTSALVLFHLLNS
jgi:hypothetical protein